MISNSAYTAVYVILVVGLMVPLTGILLYGLRNKKKGVWSAWLWGAAVFLGMQFLFRSPILSIYTMYGGGLAENVYVIYCLVLVLIVAALEIGARYVIVCILNRKELTYKRSIAAGMGYEGIEAVVTLGIPYVFNLLVMQMINGGVMEEVLKTAEEAGNTADFKQVCDALVNTTPLEFYLVAYGSVISMVIHATLTLFVCHVVWRKKTAMAIWASMAVYAGIDFITMMADGMATPYLGNVISLQTSLVIKYVVLTIAAILAILYIVLIHITWKSDGAEAESGVRANKKSASKLVAKIESKAGVKQDSGDAPK